MVKILCLVSVMLFLMLIIAGSAYLSSRELSERIQSLYSNDARSAIMTTEAKALSIHNRSLILSLLQEDDAREIESIIKNIDDNRKKSDALLSSIKQDKLAPDEKELLGRLREIGAECIAKRNEIIAIGVNKTDLDTVSGRLKTGGDVEKVEREYIETFTALTTLLMESAEEENADSQDAASEGAMRILLISVIAIVFGLAFGIFISHTITNSIVEIQQNIKLLANGDLTSSFTSNSSDELGMMSAALQGMADNVKRIISSVKSSNVSILDTSEEFSNLAKRTHESVAEFHSNVDEMGMNLNSLVVTGEEVNASVQQVAAGAQTTAEKGTDIARRVDDAMKAGEAGMSSVRNAVSGIERVVDNASSTAKSVRELAERTKQIQNFVSQIGGIADQTNLLALNAAIEAARAGEAGRGFAVVAEEVRKLAEDSNIAAKNIEGLAKTITEELSNVVDMSITNTHASEDAKNISRETADIIENMISYMEEVSGATQDLAAVAQQQAASSEEIAEAIQRISERVQSTAKSGENIRSGVGGLAKSAERLTDGSEGISEMISDMEKLLSFFKMDEPNTPSGRLI
jgi:methyl-accepting chemotaxis protein